MSYTITFPIQVPANFDFQATIRSHGFSHLAPFRWNQETETLIRTEQLSSGRVVLLNMTQPHTNGLVQIKAQSHTKFTTVEKTEMKRRIAYMLRLEEDMNGFQDLWRTAQPPSFPFPRSRGRMLRAPTLWEDTVKIIATTNINWVQTVAMIDRLVAELGSPYPEELVHHAFPTPEQVATNGYALTERVRMGYRNASVLEIARAIYEGRLNLESYRDSPLAAQELRKELKKLRGIGDYAAACLLMALGRYDYLPIDSEAHRHVSQTYFMGGKVTARQIEAIYERWKSWQYLVYWFDMARREHGTL